MSGNYQDTVLDYSKISLLTYLLNTLVINTNECINVLMFVGKCTNCGTGDMCGVCNAQQCTSADRPITRTCTNCGVQSSGSICTRCHSLPRCVTCHRHLPPACFPSNSLLCQACCNKQEKPHVRASERNIITEVAIPTARATHSFDSFLSHNAGVISNIIDDYRRQYRSIRCLLYTSPSPRDRTRSRMPSSA